jgi:hypothetical protein
MEAIVVTRRKPFDRQDMFRLESLLTVKIALEFFFSVSRDTDLVVLFSSKGAAGGVERRLWTGSMRSESYGTTVGTVLHMWGGYATTL